MSSLNPAAPPRYLVRESCAKMPIKVKAAYRWCAVMEVDGDLPIDFHPAAIDKRIKGVRRIIASWGPYPAAGKTARSGRIQAETAAEAMIARLEAAWDAKQAAAALTDAATAGAL